MKEYLCIKDRQGGDFSVGVCDTAEGWKSTAMGWADSDGNGEEYEYLSTIGGEKVIQEIDEYWEITLVEVDGNKLYWDDIIEDYVYFLNKSKDIQKNF